MASEMRFQEVKRMLEAKGYFLDRIAGSHHVFKKPGARSLPIRAPRQGASVLRSDDKKLET